ncbi:hematopoietic SH2 domain-containing protein homolog isoform X2 [Rhincodon typus]|nr:hematopoietic SH2 domain-containing protein homolog isoform X2 [Rhincodon typus]
MDMTVTRKAAITWFTTTQAAKLLRGGTIPDWFHGIITRREAEELLKDKPQGCFLIRVGESRIGLSLSYRGFDRCRHFIIDVTTGGQYNITGESIFHNSLQDLVNYHTQFPIDPYKECLTVPCRQLSQSTVHYEELCLFVPTKEVQGSPTPHSSSSSSNPEPSDPAPDRWTASLSKQVSSGPRLPPRGNRHKMPPLPLPRRGITDSKPTPETRTSSGGQPSLLPVKRLYPSFSQLTALSTEQEPIPAVTASDPRNQRNQPSSPETTMCHSNSEFKHQASDNLNSRQSNPIPPQRQPTDHPNPRPIPPQRQPIDHPNPKPIPPQRQPINHPNPWPIPPQRQPIDHPNPWPITPQRQPTDHMTDTKYTGDSPSNMSHSDLLFPALNNSHHSPRTTRGQSLSQGQFMPHRHIICSRQFDEKKTVEGAQLPTEGEVREQESGSFDLPIEYMTPPPYAPGY